jgi:hypothetical protein
MTRIIAARVETQERGETIVAALRKQQFDETQVFYVNPPGQHASHLLGGDMESDSGAQSAPEGQAAGATAGAAVGAVVGAVASVAAPLVAPAVVAGLAGVGAHVGGLVGAMKRTRDAEDEREATQREDPGPEARDTRRGGLMVAMNLGDADEGPVVELLQRMGATDIERADGNWRNGDWVDFDPVAPPKLVEPEREER